jgi:hypothetical protein
MPCAYISNSEAIVFGSVILSSELIKYSGMSFLWGLISGATSGFNGSIPLTTTPNPLYSDFSLPSFITLTVAYNLLFGKSKRDVVYKTSIATIGFFSAQLIRKAFSK